MGGTGFYFDAAKPLPEEIEHHMPDYNLYDDWIELEVDKLKNKAEQEGKGNYTRMILSPNRPETDFMEEKARGVVTREVLYGVDFLVVTILN